MPFVFSKHPGLLTGLAAQSEQQQHKQHQQYQNTKIYSPFLLHDISVGLGVSFDFAQALEMRSCRPSRRRRAAFAVGLAALALFHAVWANNYVMDPIATGSLGETVGEGVALQERGGALAPQTFFSIDDLFASLDALQSAIEVLLRGTAASSAPALQPQPPPVPVPSAAAPSGVAVGSLGSVVNALGPGQDPGGISRIEGKNERVYYFPTNDFGRKVMMRRATDLNQLFSDPKSEKVVFTYPTDVGTEAPSLYEFAKGDWVLFVSSVGPQGGGVMRVLRSATDDPMGSWNDLGPMYDAAGKPLVDYDGHAFTHPNGRRYFMYSALRAVWIAELITPTRLGRAVNFVASNSRRTVEAPGSWISGKTLNLFWSENVFAEKNYNVLNRALSVDVDPLDPRSWSSTPTVLLLQASGRVNGPGSAVAFVGPDNTPWLAYSCFYAASGSFPLSTNPRRVQAQPLKISSTGELLPIVPVQPERFI